MTRIRPYPTMKDSGVPWLGNVPEHWRPGRLGESVTGCVNGIWGDEPNGVDDLVCVRVADFDRQRLKVSLGRPTFRAVSPTERQRRMLLRGDLLLEKSGGGDLQPVGVVVLYDHDSPAVCSNFVARMRIAPGFDPQYLNYLHSHLYAIRLNVRSIKQTTGIQNLDSSAYLGEPVAFPPLDEQRAIARYLDYMDRRIRQYIRAKQKLIALLEEQKQAIVHRAVTRGLDPDVPLKPSGVEWLGDVPAHWEVRPLKQCIRRGTSISYGIVQPGDHVPNGVPFVQTGNLTSLQFEGDQLQRTSPEIARRYPRSTLMAGDVILGIRASVGMAAVVPRSLGGANLSRGIARIVPDGSVTPSFLALFLNSNAARTFWFTFQQGTTFNEIPISLVRNLPVLLPPVSEQVEIIAASAEETHTLNDVIDRAQREINLLREYRTRLIADVVTGKLDVREAAASLPDEADEPEEYEAFEDVLGENDAGEAPEDGEDAA